MTHNRRDLALLMAAAASSTAALEAADSSALPSATFRFEDLKVRQSGQNRGRNVLEGATRSGYKIEMHETELGPGSMPHAAHKHVHEEMMLIREGIMEVTIEGKVSKVGPGGVVYVASNEMHGWRNAGDTTAHYFVLTLGR
jgi:quercetin dioxygenase-like cupin family protein